MAKPSVCIVCRNGFHTSYGIHKEIKGQLKDYEIDYGGLDPYGIGREIKKKHFTESYFIAVNPGIAKQLVEELGVNPDMIIVDDVSTIDSVVSAIRNIPRDC